MTQDYECPKCGYDVPVRANDDQVECGDCHAILVVDRDAEFINGKWCDRTKLVQFEKT